MTVDSITLSTDTERVTLTPEQFRRGVDALTVDRPAGPGDTERAEIPSDRAFLGDYLAAPALEALARRLIATERRFAFLREWEPTIALLWKRQGGKKGAAAVFGKCQTLSGAARHFAGKSYLIWAAADHCRGARFTRRQLEALVFHELCHLAPGDADEDGEAVAATPPVIVGHDYEGFLAELEVYGAWRTDLARAHEAFAQLPLWGEE